ncbi:glycosyltransferase [Candidatus Bipolaricaulota bacterium]|nr:glycosyltransferase [Candidatus Bipolaricaulota bacterium]
MVQHNSISVVIPAYNEENWIDIPLDSLDDQDFEGEYEVIVVDNASDDRTGEIAREYGARVIEEPEKGCTRAYQTGFEAARHPIIAVTDADTKVPSNWLSLICDSFDRPDIVGVYGSCTFYDSSRYMNWLAKYGFSAFLRFNDLVGKPHLDGFNMAVSSEVFHEVGGFNLSMKSASDVDLSQRLKDYGRLVYNKELVVKTSARRLEEWGMRFFVHHAINYLNVVWLRRPERARGFDDIR